MSTARMPRIHAPRAGHGSSRHSDVVMTAGVAGQAGPSDRAGRLRVAAARVAEPAGRWLLLKPAADITDPGRGRRVPPASAGRAGTRQSPPSDFRHRSDSVLSTRNRLVYGGLAVWWVFVNIEFWGFWLGSAGQSTGWLYWPATAALSYQC